MKRYLSAIVFVGLLAAASAAADTDAIPIKIKEPGQGDTYNIEETKTNKSSSKVVDAQGKTLNEMKENTTITSAYKETIIKAEANKRPTKMERAYTKAEMKKGDKAEDLGLAGKTVVIEKKGDNYTFTFKGGEEVKGDAAKVLADDFKDKGEESNQIEKLLLPKDPVKPGSEWKLDMGPILKELGKGGDNFDVDKDKAAGTGKLVKAYKKDGKQYGELQYKIELPIKGLGMLKFPNGAKMILEFSMDACIDGTSAAGSNKMKMTMDGSAPIANVGTLSLTLDIEGTQKQTEAKK